MVALKVPLAAIPPLSTAVPVVVYVAPDKGPVAVTVSVVVAARAAAQSNKAVRTRRILSPPALL